MDNIGKRAALAILGRVGNHDLGMELDRLELTRQCLYQWEVGKHAPGGKMLRKMALAGYDVIYILTGKETKNEN